MYAVQCNARSLFDMGIRPCSHRTNRTQERPEVKLLQKEQSAYTSNESKLQPCVPREIEIRVMAVSPALRRLPIDQCARQSHRRDHADDEGMTTWRKLVVSRKKNACSSDLLQNIQLALRTKTEEHIDANLLDCLHGSYFRAAQSTSEGNRL